jgi:hypothetical protein
MAANIFDISFDSLNLFSFVLGMTFASFLSWYRRTAFMYIIAYFMGLAFYYGAVKPNIDTVPVDNHKTTLEPKSGYTPPLPIPEPRKYK